MNLTNKIFVYENDNEIYSRNCGGRVIFRYSKIDDCFSIYRSPRIKNYEISFCLMMYDKIKRQRDICEIENIIKAFEYKLNEDLFCT